MIRKISMLAAIVIALSTIGIGANAVYAANTQVPFAATYSGTASFTDNPYINLLDGTGIATHLGRSTNHALIVITGADNSCSGGIANTNYETLTAANGDSLTLTSYDIACPVGPGMYHGTGQWSVTGGTGRFSGATGQGTFEGHSDFNQGVFTFNLTGTISAPNGE
jgi:hypothetical protein